MAHGQRFLATGTIVLILSLFFVRGVAAKIIPVPFTPQAPDGDWRQPWQDACEEAAITMVNAYYNHAPLTKTLAKQEIWRIVNAEVLMYGSHKDTNADQMIATITALYSWEAYRVSLPTIKQINQEIDAGRPVIVPVYGRALHNPYFQNGGPDYHTVVIAGYDDAKKEYIVEEPGTRHGLDWRYSYDTLLGAIHDFVPGNRTKTGQKVVLFTRPARPEAVNGILPPLPQVTWLKISNQPFVYLVAKKQKHRITDVLTVSQPFFNQSKKGAKIRK